MLDYNRIQIMGRLGHDPLCRETKEGLKISQFSVATSRRTKNEKGEEAEMTDWHRVVVFGRAAELAGQYLRKGSAVFVEGSLRSSRYEDKNGSMRTTYEINADFMNFLSPKPSQNADRTDTDVVSESA